LDRNAYIPRHASTVQLDGYDFSTGNLVKIEQLLAFHNVRVMIWYDLSPAGVPFDVLRRYGTKVIQSNNFGSDSKDWHKGVRLLFDQLRAGLGYRHFDLYVANGRWNYEFLVKHRGIPRKRVRMISNGVDTERFAPGTPPKPEELGIPGDACFYVVSVCQARPEKRVEILIDAAAEILRRRSNLPIRFLHVGAGHCLDDWRSRATAANVQDRFHFIGEMVDPAPIYRLPGVLAHTSERESFGLVIAEAMASGMPAVCLRAGGPNQLIRHGHDGWLVEQDDLEGFVATILDVADDADKVRLAGAAARERIVRDFSLRRQIADWCTLLID
jgi:glycosyltransferase involved in cell wall biosynthesis